MPGPILNPNFWDDVKDILKESEESSKTEKDIEEEWVLRWEQFVSAYEKNRINYLSLHE